MEQAREKITRLHRQASSLPLLELGDVIELEGEACHLQDDDPLLNLKFGALRLEDIAPIFNNQRPVIKWSQLIGFDVFPGEGCSRSSFGLSTSRDEPMSWQWYADCKTQYACNPDYGGIKNFLKCHLSVVKILACAQQLDILSEAIDPSGFWENRDLEALVKHVTQENIFIAAIMGSLKDAIKPLGYSADAPILERADFEYLEAKSQDLHGP